MKFKISKKPLEPRTFSINPPNVSSWSLTAKGDKVILQTIIVWLSGILFSLIIITLFFNAIPNEIPLFYSRAIGSDQLSKKLYLLLLPGGTFGLGIINLCFILIAYKKEKIISYTFCLITVLVTLLSTLSVLNIIHLIT